MQIQSLIACGRNWQGENANAAMYSIGFECNTNGSAVWKLAAWILGHETRVLVPNECAIELQSFLRLSLQIV